MVFSSIGTHYHASLGGEQLAQNKDPYAAEDLAMLLVLRRTLIARREKKVGAGVFRAIALARAVSSSVTSSSC